MNNFINYSIESIFIIFCLFIIGIFMQNKIIILFSIILLVCVLYFFRGWNNNVTNIKDNIIYSPCEGKIISIKENNGYYHLAIFLNLNNIHVQYMPISGLIKKIFYKKGEFNPAYFFEKSNYNERMITYIETQYGLIEFHQIAGQIARRIEVFNKESDYINALEPHGLIKFGSRCDLIIPINSFIINKNIKINKSINIGDIIDFYKN